MVKRQAEIVGVYVGQPQLIGETRRGPVESAIGKAPVTASELALGTTNLAGDRQADLVSHGGPDKAVYAYPSESYAGWQADGFAVDPGGLGENLSLRGLTEHAVHVGDVWRWGGALVEVSQPRSPCYKLSVHTGRKDIGPHLVATARSGWYMRVVEPGLVPTQGTITLVERPARAPTVYETFTVMFDGDREIVARVLAAPALAEQWRIALDARQNGGRS